MISDEIFREYDIRGVYPDTINEDAAYTIGRAFASYIDTDTVLVGRDNRLSSPAIHDNLIRGLNDSGANVIDIGIVTTPMYYFAKKREGIKNSIQITASHNPKDYNGLKISFNPNYASFGDEIRNFKKFIDEGNFKEGTGTVTPLDIRDDYAENIKNSLVFGDRKPRIVVDCANGTGSTIIKEVMSKLPIECDFLYCESDANFPNHHPDPAVTKNQEDLAKRVVELGYDMGFGVDGDADRCGIVDDKGNIYLADYYMTLMYRYLYNKLDERKAFFDVKCSKTLPDELERLGYTYEITRTGAPYTVNKTNNDHLVFGGEFSGHFAYTDRYIGIDDGIYSGLRIAEMLSYTDRPLSSLFNGLNRYFSTEEIMYPVEDAKKPEIVATVKKYCDDKGYKYVDVDGVRVLFDDGWALVRASNTTPNLTIRFEAKTEERLNEIQSEFTNYLDSIK